MKSIIEVAVEIQWYFAMNPMQGRTEQRQRVGAYDTKEAAIADYMANKVPTYHEAGTNPWGDQPTNWRKCFKKDSPFEWFNPIQDETFETKDEYGYGLYRTIDMLGDIISQRPFIPGQ